MPSIKSKGTPADFRDSLLFSESNDKLYASSLLSVAAEVSTNQLT